MPNDFNNVKSAVVDTIVGEVNSLITGANADIAAFANDIAQDSLEAAATGQLDQLPALERQVQLLMEKNRIALANGAERVVYDVIRIALGVATKLVIPSIPQL